MQVTGEAHAASYGGAVVEKLTTTVSAMEAVYTDAMERINNDAARINLGTDILGRAFGGPVIGN
jgi:hypothetical protein